MSSKKIPKRLVLLDEGLSPRKNFPKINSYHRVKHIRHDLNRLGKEEGDLTDEEIYNYARKKDAIIITINTLDFAKLLVSNNCPTIIALKSGLLPGAADIKIFSILANKSIFKSTGKLYSVTKDGYTLSKNYE